jgi:hypothetical protein
MDMNPSTKKIVLTDELEEARGCDEKEEIWRIGVIL